MVVTVSHGGYIKRVPLTTYRAQRRGGKGRSGMATKDEDFVTRLFVPIPIRRCCSSPRAASPTR
jgi:DNA gyrase subunit A